MILKYNDKQHSYWLDGKRCTSVTSVADILDDTWNLDRWRERQIAIGLASSPDLVERVAAHFDEKDQIDTICKEAQQRAGAHKAAGKGTAAHRITERHDAGSDLIETEFSRRVRHAWQSVLDRHQLEVVLSERIVIWPDQLVAGRFDRVCRRPDGSLVVVDLKTGDRAIQYPHSIAIQLALYACAPYIAAEIPPSGGTTESFIDMCMPDTTGTIDPYRAIVVHLPDGGDAQAYEFDIAKGMEAARLCFGALAWRKQAALCWQLGARSEDESNSDAGREVEGGAPGPRRPSADRRPNEGPGDPVHGSGVEEPHQGTGQDPAALLAAIEALPPDVYETFKRYAKDRGLPGPKKLAQADADQLEAVAAALQQAKDACLYSTPEEQAAWMENATREFKERYGPRDQQPVAGAEGRGDLGRLVEPGHGESRRPALAAETPQPSSSVAGTGPDRTFAKVGGETGPVCESSTGATSEAGGGREGPPANPSAVADLAAQLGALSNQQQNIIRDWLAQAKAAGVFFGNLKQNPTTRRYHLARACWALVTHMDGDDELVRLALAFVAGDDAVRPGFPTGAIIGALSVEEAERLYGVASGWGERYVLGAGELVEVGA